MAYLTLSLKGREVSRHPVAGDMRIGRDPSNDLVIENVGVSRHHASVVTRGAGLFSVKDEGSQNGVFVNGRRITAHELVDGDVIQIGKFTLEYRSGSVGAAPSVPKPAAPKLSGSGRDKLKTFALSADQLQEVLVTSKGGGGVKVPSSQGRAPVSAAVPAPTQGQPQNPIDSWGPEPPAQTQPQPQAQSPWQAPKTAEQPPVNSRAKPDVGTQYTHPEYPPMDDFVERAAPQRTPATKPKSELAPVLWVALGLTVVIFAVAAILL